MSCSPERYGVAPTPPVRVRSSRFRRAGRRRPRIAPTPELLDGELFDPLAKEPQVAERVAHAAQALPAELRDREDDGSPSLAYSLERRRYVSKVELQHDR
jgi:hypothetical protein